MGSNGNQPSGSVRRLTGDLRPETRTERARFDRARRAERRYALSLRKIARHIGDIVHHYDLTDLGALAEIESSLHRYAEAITPWAKATAVSMIADVSRRDEVVWAALSREMGRALRTEIATAPTGQILRTFMAEQVKLIRSLPLEAAQRVHDLTIESRASGARASEIAERIRETGDVTVSRANLIARTEVARTASGLTMARATHIGSDGYVWRTAKDEDVRRTHKKMEGKLVRWDSPPQLDGMTGHAGMFPNCRCYPEPVIPRKFS